MNRLAIWYLAEITWSVLTWAFRCFLMLAVVSTAAADTILIVKTDGKHVVFDTATGETSPAPFDAVYVEQGIPRGPGPDDPDDPPSPPSDFAQEVQRLAEAIDDPSGAALFAQGVYGQFEKEVRRGGVPISANDINDALTELLEKAMVLYPQEALGKKDEWEDFHDAMLQELSSRLIKNNRKMTQEQYADFFGEVNDGLEAATAGNAIPVWLQPIIEALIRVAIRILQDLFAHHQYETLKDIVQEVTKYMPPPIRRRRDEWVERKVSLVGDVT